MPSILIFGATGFIGTPLTKAIKQAHSSWEVTAFVRPGKSGDAIKSTLGVDHVVFGDISDFQAVKTATQHCEIAVNAASSFDGRIVSAIVEGLKERPRGSKATLVHLSGAGNFIDMGETGEYNSESKAWNDNNEDDIKQIHDKMFNGHTDTAVLEAGNQGLETYIVCPSVVYGTAAVGAQNLGIGYQFILENAKSLGFVPYIGNGSAVLSTVHVLDVIFFLLKILEQAEAGPALGSASARYYLLETVQVTWKELAMEMAPILHRTGLFDSPEARSVGFEQAGQGEVKHLVGSNMLIRGDRAARAGFRATHEGILEQMHWDLGEAML